MAWPDNNTMCSRVSGLKDSFRVGRVKDIAVSSVLVVTFRFSKLLTMHCLFFRQF